MSEPIVAERVDDALITRLITHESPEAQCFGRLLATGINGELEDFLNHELRRGTQPGLILAAMVRLSVQVVGSILAQRALAADRPATAAIAVRMFDAMLKQHIAGVEQYLAKERTSDG